MRRGSLVQLTKRAALTLAIAGVLTFAVPRSAFAQYPSGVNDYSIVCVNYTETTGACWETITTNGVTNHNMYFFWGNWWVQVG